MTGATVRRPSCYAAKRLSRSARRENARAFVAKTTHQIAKSWGKRVIRLVRHKTTMLGGGIYLQRTVSALQQASGWCDHPHSVPYSHLLTVMTGATVRRPWRYAAKLLSTSARRENARAFIAQTTHQSAKSWDHRVIRQVRHKTKMLGSVLYLQRPVSALQQASGWCDHPHSVPYSHLLTHGMTGATVRRPRCCAAKRLSTSLRREKAKGLPRP